MSKYEILKLFCSFICLIFAALMTWELCTPESWRIGLPEFLDKPLGLTIGIWMGWGLAGERK